MNFQLKCRNHMECPDELKEAIREKVQRFEPLVPEPTYVEIELLHYAKAQRGGDKEAQVIVDIPGVKPVIRFACAGQTYLEAVDRVLDKLDGELSDQKDRQHDYSYNGLSPKERVAETIQREATEV